MNAPKLFVAAIGAVVLVGGMAAVGAAAPANAANATQSADGGQSMADDASADAGEMAQADEGPDAVGPADGLPAQVSDRVSEIHGMIEAFGDGAIDDLGDALSGLLPDDPAESGVVDGDADAQAGAAGAA